MKHTFIGKSKSGSEIVVYILDEAKEVLKILNKLQEVSPGYSFCENPNHYMRFCSIDENLYLITGTLDAGNDGKTYLNTFYADEVESALKEVLKDYPYLETAEGLYEINLNGMEEVELKDIMLSFMSAERDFNLVMPSGSVHMAWMPVLEKGMYCLKPVLCPSYDVEEWDIKTLEGYDIVLV